MCVNCGLDYLGLAVHPPLTSEMADLATEIRALERDEPDASGLHLVLDDWNLDDHFFAACRENGLSDREEAIAARLEALGVAERYVVLVAAEDAIALCVPESDKPVGFVIDDRLAPARSRRASPMAAETKAPTAYRLACRRCDKPEVLTFPGPAERGRWASQHTRETGHDQWLVRDGGEITITFVAECPDCRDFTVLMNAADVLDDRQLLGSQASSGYLREFAKVLMTMSGMADDLASLIVEHKFVPPWPQSFAARDERDQRADSHSSTTGHAVETRTEIR